MKRLIFPILILGGLFLFGSKFTDAAQFLSLLKDGVWYGIIALIFFSFLALLLQAELIREIFLLFKIKLPLKVTFPLLLASNFANFIVPALGFSGTAIFASVAKEKNLPLISTLATSIFYYIVYYFTFGIVLAIALIFLFTTRNLEEYQIITGGIFFIFLSIIFLLFITLAHSKKRSLKIMTLLVSILNKPFYWLRKRELVKQEFVSDFAGEVYAHLTRVRKEKYQLLRSGLFGLLAHSAFIMLLGYIFITFQIPVNLFVVITGYAIAVLFSLVSVTPAGIGFVESAMVLVFRSLGFPLEIAFLIMIVYRGLTFWLPFIGGLISLKLLHVQQKNPQAI